LLEDVVASFLESLTEREFDAPFMALLRAHGFQRIHFLHGQFEFGKDFIAQRDDPPTQFAFQTKAGDINLPQWSSSVRGQVEIMRTNTLAHPDFDAELPRVGVLVLTGRLTGGAPLEVQNFLAAIPSDDPRLDLWDRERLVELFTASPAAGLTGFSDGPFLELLGRIDNGSATESRIERFSERWIGTTEGVGWRAMLEAALLANRLRRADRLDLAAFTALCSLRAIWATIHGTEDRSNEEVARRGAAVGLFETYAAAVWELASDDLLTPRAIIQDDLGLMVTYPVQCARVLEVLGLYGLLNADLTDDIAAWLKRFMDCQPGAAHPLSDRWAVSLLPAIILVGRTDKEAVRSFVTEVLRWLGDRYDEDERGLAGPYADPDVEVAYFLGGSLEHVELRERRESYLAAVLLDLAAVLQDADLYDLAYNEIAAVDIRPFVTLPRDDVNQYLTAGHGVDVPVNTSPKYAEQYAEGDGWRMAAHHDDDVSRYYLGRLGYFWDHLTLSIVSRDRYWVAGLRRLLLKES